MRTPWLPLLVHSKNNNVITKKPLLDYTKIRGPLELGGGNKPQERVIHRDRGLT
jgi:hypothetical protein